MADDLSPDEQLLNPDRVDAPDGTRVDGRPTGGASVHDAPPGDSVPTVAPEEEGATPTTEHAPGADL